MLTAVHSTKPVSKRVWSAKMFGLLALSSLSLAGCAGLVGSDGTKTPPPTTLAISNVQAGGATTSGFQVSWATNAPADSAVDYGTTASYGTTAPVSSAMVTAHQIALTGLKAGTLYHFRVRSTDASGNAVASGDATDATMGDTVAPTVSVTSPAANATLSGNVNVTATATDNIGVASVQFKVDGANSGAAIAVAPYALSLNTTTLSNGNHVLTAVASDAAGNSATSASVTVKVNNTTLDTTPPTVSLTAPANGATVSSTVNVTANATDNVSVASVQFQLDGTNVGSALVAAPFVFSWDTTKSTNGAHALRAIAKDGAGNSTTSAAVSVTVSNSTPDTTPPTVSVSAPAGGATVSGTVTVSANASDNVGVASVQFRLDGANLGSLDTASPYSIAWNTTTATNGAHTLSAVAKDAAGNTATSANVSVNVNNGSADTQAPSVPTGLTATAISSSQVNLSWTASTDNLGVTGYNIYRGGTKISTSTSTTFQDGGLAASTTFSYTVAAFDAAGNNSAQSTPASATTQASSGGGIPSSLGWFQIPNTQYQKACPSDASIQGQTGCSAVADAWAGGTADTTRNWLVFTGGGHHDYWGNEVYALDLNALAIKRLNNPSSIGSLNFMTQSSETLPDGTPSARHTYGGMAFVPTSDLIYMYGGGISGIGDLSHVTWTLKHGSLSAGSTGVCCWSQKNPSGGTPDSQFGELAEYDANTDSVFLWDPWQSQAGHLWQYKVSSNAYTLLTTFGGSAFMDGYQSGAIDTAHKLFFAVGKGKLLKVSIAAGSNYAVTDAAGAPGCAAGVSGTYPGVAYDSVSQKLVIWQAGNSVTVYDPTANSCSTVTYSGGPASDAQNGTFGRFRYFPALGVFAVCNSWTANCYTLRLEAGSGTPPPASPPVVSGVGTSGVSSSGATVNWTTDIASTSQVDYGTSTAYGSSTTLNSALVTSHAVAVSGLLSGTTYHYRVRSQNSGGNETISGDFSFATTSAGDTTPPTVSVTAPASNTTVSGSVTVSATASDNVGVTSVQFQVDGVNLGAAVTQPPYSTTWDTTGTSNGGHTVTAVARDAAANSATSVAVAVSVSNGTTNPPPGGANSWQSRIAGLNTPGGAASIVSSLDFDTFPATNKQQYFQVYSAPNINSDCSVAADGCSLRFTMQPGMFQGEPGWFNYNFNSSLNALYGQGQEFYVQYRERVSSALLSSSTFTNFEGWKLNILSEGDSTSAQAGNCSNTPTDFVLVSDDVKFPWIYENCGGTGSSLAFLNSAYAPIQLYAPNAPGGGNYLDQPATGCPHYSGRGTPNTDPPCWNFAADEWFTIQEHIKIGTYGLANSVVDVWMAHDGQPAVLITNAADIAIADQGPSITDKFGKIVLLPYATGATWNVLSQVWYDDLIVSNRRIPDPEVSTPNAPDSLTLSGISSSSVTVNWRVNSNNNTAQDDTGFLVERCTGNAATCFIAPQSGFAQIGTTAAHLNSFVDNTVTAGKTYTYRVRASNANGKSGYASAICFNGGATCGGTAAL
jgi:Big-like domain-containing protein/purple acid phosphatase-like protein/fibronectin type III domain protein